ncbi:MAG: DUF1778 domain-containing protein [Chlorobaculum sp.]|nr:DUF1778 domain-containing protein [Chlorobaculum sp.]
MPRTPVNTCHRLSLQIDPKQMSMLIQAVPLQSNGLADFDTRTSIIAPQAVIEQHERLELSEKQTLWMLDLLEAPPAPKAKLMAAIAALPSRSCRFRSGAKSL